MGDSMLNVLKKNLATLDSSVHWLERSYKKCLDIGVKDSYSEDEYDVYETLTARYARTVDLIVNRVLRSVDATELMDPGSTIDAANRAAKRGIVDSVSELRDLKAIRNEIAHEYAADNLKELFGTILALVPDVLTIATNVERYCERFWV
jgi:uncharacterized protein YutE (UPF0331/DUF86 family)